MLALLNDRASLGPGLEAMRAFVFSVRQTTERVLIKVQIKHLPLYVAVSGAGPGRWKGTNRVSCQR